MTTVADCGRKKARNVKYGDCEMNDALDRYGKYDRGLPETWDDWQAAYLELMGIADALAAALTVAERERGEACEAFGRDARQAR